MTTTYTCPMHPEVQKQNTGLCPECGMNLVPQKGKASTEQHDAHAGHHANPFKVRFWMAFVLSIPVVLYSPIVGDIFAWQPPAFPGSLYLPAVLASVIFWYGGWIFLTSAWRELRAGLPGMMTLISLAIVTAYSYSIVQVVIGGTRTLFWELSTLIAAMLLGHWLEMRAVTGAQGALKELSRLIPDTAEVLRGGEPIRVPLAEVQVGDVVMVRPGGRIPVDGTVSEGASEVDESVATGESKPVEKQKGDEVIAGTSNGHGVLHIKVTHIGEQTFLSGVMRLVAEAQASKSRLQMLSDRAAYWLTLLAITVGSITLISWLAIGAGADTAIERAVAVLVITCPHALGLAVPLVASISTTKAARNGFLIRQRLALEAARSIDVVLFDKTGTLTTGTYKVTALEGLEGSDPSVVLQMAASVDASSEHPVSRAIVEYARSKKVSLLPAENFKRIGGKGVEGRVDGKQVRVGGEAMQGDQAVRLPQAILEEQKRGHTIIFVFVDDQPAGVLALGDSIREESRQAVSQLQAQGISVAMITGDSEAVASWVAGELGIQTYFARVLPEQKSERVKELQAEGKRVAMVGDGINDAPALTQADVGIAIGAGTNVAIESAGVILVRDDPRDIPKIVRLSRLTYSKMVQNLFWATGYNVVAIPLAAGVFAWRGIVLQPAVAALLMSLSTVIVAANALLLRARSLET